MNGLLLPLLFLARSHAVQHPSGIPMTPKNVLWVGAHPDDEVTVAPLLSEWCRDEHARCTLLIVTAGDQGSADLAAVRTAEAAAAAKSFNADLILYGWPDGGGLRPPSWPINASSILANDIQRIHPDLILAFDPRHGSSCHPDHRAVGQLVLDATKTNVYLLETRIVYSASPFAIDFQRGAITAERIDATDRWNTIIDDMRNHTSQFDSSWIAAVENMPMSERAVYVAPADSVMREYVAGCP